MSKRLTIEEFIKTLKSGSGSGGSEPLIVEFSDEVVERPGKYSSTPDWFIKTQTLKQDIIDAYMSFRPVYFHINPVPGYGVLGGWATMSAVYNRFIDGPYSGTYPDFDRDCFNSSDGVFVNLLDEFDVDDDGRLMIQIWVLENY